MERASKGDEGDDSMSAATSTTIDFAPAEEPLHVTLLQLVEAVSDVTENDVEVVATVMHMLQTGRVRLSGSFRGVSISTFS
jgi:hypothetical protein